MNGYPSNATGAANLDLSYALQHLPSPVVITNRGGKIHYANAAAQAILPGCAVGADIAAIFQNFPQLEANGRPQSQIALSSDTAGEFEATVAELPGLTVIFNLHPRTAEPSHADIDELTGAVTRNGAIKAMAAALSQHQGDTPGLAVHRLDLDRFKLVSDTLGHAVGNLLLKKVVQRLRAACKASDVIARLDGNQFAVVQTGVTDAADAERLAARFVDLVARTYVLSGKTINISASVGAALQSKEELAEDIMRHAELALDEGKRGGAGPFRLFEPSMDALLQFRREVEIDLRRALALRQFHLHFQPFLDLSNDQVRGFEALLRWNRPGLGNMSPAEFIPIAQEHGLITAIGEWVLKTACVTAAAWPDHLTVAVNVSPIQFKAENLLQTVQRCLDISGLDPTRLELEITEGALLTDTENVLSTLHAIKALGVKISMDDFGTGYSSRSYLQKFPFDKIKIDRSFVANASSDSQAILKAVAGLGSSLGMAITAEGVETPEQLERIRSQKCTLVQGYLIGKPMAADHIDQYLETFRYGTP